MLHKTPTSTARMKGECSLRVSLSDLIGLEDCKARSCRALAMAMAVKVMALVTWMIRRWIRHRKTGFGRKIAMLVK